MVESYDEGYLSLARSEIVGNANFFHIGEDLGLASCRIVSTRMDPMERWTPGYQSTAMVGGDGSLEEVVVDLDRKKILARERRKDHKVGDIKMRDFRLVSYKAQAACIESMISRSLLKFGMLSWTTW